MIYRSAKILQMPIFPPTLLNSWTVWLLANANDFQSTLASIISLLKTFAIELFLCTNLTRVHLHLHLFVVFNIDELITNKLIFNFRPIKKRPTYTCRDRLNSIRHTTTYTFQWTTDRILWTIVDIFPFGNRNIWRKLISYWFPYPYISYKYQSSTFQLLWTTVLRVYYAYLKCRALEWFMMYRG